MARGVDRAIAPLTFARVLLFWRPDAAAAAEGAGDARELAGACQDVTFFTQHVHSRSFAEVASSDESIVRWRGGHALCTLLDARRLCTEIINNLLVRGSQSQQKVPLPAYTGDIMYILMHTTRMRSFFYRTRRHTHTYSQTHTYTKKLLLEGMAECISFIVKKCMIHRKDNLIRMIVVGLLTVVNVVFKTSKTCSSVCV